MQYANDREVNYDVTKSPLVAVAKATSSSGLPSALSATRVARRFPLPAESVEHMLWICGVSQDMEKGKDVFRAAVGAESAVSTSTMNAFVAMLLSCGNLAAATHALRQWDTQTFRPDEVTAALAELIVTETNEREQQRHLSLARTAEELTSFRERSLDELFPKLARTVPVLSALRPMRSTADDLLLREAAPKGSRLRTLDE